MTNNYKLIKISIFGEVSEIDYKEYRKETKDRTQSSFSLSVPEYLGFRLSCIMLDTFQEYDDLNIGGTFIYNLLRSTKNEDIICGDIYITNESVDDLIDFSINELKYILEKMERNDIIDYFCL
jgi:hypothetical protein